MDEAKGGAERVLGQKKGFQRKKCFGQTVGNQVHFI